MSKEKQIEEICKILTEAAHKACEDIPFAPPSPDDRCIRPNMECHRCKEARALIDAGYRKQSEWISVEDRLPEENGRYLIFDGKDINVSWFKKKDAYYSYIWGNNFTHWMPLLEAPKMRKEDEKNETN